jgi:DNA-binding CsgD family transcriptional regulator/PAS domain-containing protein
MKKSKIDAEQLSHVISTIYDCALDPGQWPRAIQQVCGLVEGKNGVIMVVDTSGTRSRFDASWNVDHALMRIYSEKFHGINPLLGPWSAFDVDQAYNVAIVMEPKRWMETRVYREFGEPNDFLDSIGVTLLKNAARFATMSVARPIKAGFSGEHELNVMRLLAPHLRKAITIANFIEMKELTSAAFDALLAPILLINDEGHIIHCNNAARDLLVSADPIRSEGGSLAARATDSAKALDSALSAVLNRSREEPETAQVVFTPFSDGRAAFAHVLPIRSGTPRGQFEPRAAAAVFITPASEASGLPFQAWASAFGLTAAEVRVLEALSKGLSIIEVATELEVAPTTARTHLARLMHKTGTRRQADFLHLAAQLTSPIRATH